MNRGCHPRLIRSVGFAALVTGVLAIGAAPDAPISAVAPAMAEANAAQLPAPPKDGVMGFVVNYFTYSVIQEKAACPDGPALRNREVFLGSLSTDERARLEKKENEQEFGRRWRESMVAPDGANMCSQFSKFPNRAPIREMKSKLAWGLNLDGDQSDGSANSEGCTHDNFTSPDGEAGIDNQAYRAMGCKLEWRGIDGTAGDIVRGFNMLMSSGEITQVILLRGVDSLVNDDNVEVVYGNTPDRPVVDSAGKFLRNASFTISDTMPRERNLLRGKIVNGVLTTDPAPVKLAQTYGQGGARDLRGIRNIWDLRRARLRIAFQPDGSVKGLVGGYQAIENFITSPSLGGMGSLMVAGIDCAGEYNSLKKFADGDRDPKSGQCKTISTALELTAIPAFVNDLALNTKVASKQ